ncbi:MAG: aconitase X [Acidimicrobiia bacterium]
MELNAQEQALARGEAGEAAALAMRIVVEMAEIMGAPLLGQITSAHIDGCLYHGDGGVEFAERLVEGGAKVRVPTTLKMPNPTQSSQPSSGRADPDHTRNNNLFCVHPHSKALVSG